MVDISTVKCEKCDEGQMHSKDIKTHNKFVIGLLMTIGVLLSITVIGALLGVPIIIYALKLNAASERYWVCEKCGEKIKKFD